MSKALFISYYFPPLGFAGVQRSLKFAKYLPDYGYEVSVVAGSGAKMELPDDPSMMNEAKHARVCQVELNTYEKYLAKVSALRPAKLIPFGSMHWWVRAAKRSCERAVIEEKPDLLYVTVSPFPAARVGAHISKKYNIPWVLDMRDPWALDPYYFYPTRLHHIMQMAEMERMCELADAVVMNTPNALDALARRFPRLAKRKLCYITNGWDKEDFCGLDHVPAEAQGPLTIAHTGSFSTDFAARVNPVNRKMLGLGGKKLLDYLRYSPVSSDILARSPFYLLQTIRQMIDEQLIAAGDIQLVFAGVEREDDKRLIQAYALEKQVEYKGYLNHAQSIRVLLEADVLFLPLHKPENGEFPLIVPGKTYEYLAARRPILALLPKGDAAGFVEATKMGFVCDPTNTDQIRQRLLALLKRKRNNDLDMIPDTNFINGFERRKLTGQLAKIFDDVLARKTLRVA